MTRDKIKADIKQATKHFQRAQQIAARPIRSTGVRRVQAFVCTKHYGIGLVAGGVCPHCREEAKPHG